MGRFIPEVIAANLRLPVGNAALWALILELDNAGPWTPGQVVARTNLNGGTPRDFIRKLKAGGFAEQVGTTMTVAGKNPQAAPLYRLTKRPIEAPRLRRDGSVMPELGIEAIWRAIKMAKVFTITELADLTSIERNTVSDYCIRLAGAGVLSKIPKHKTRELQFRLVRNLGRLAPKILTGKMVFDPNAGVFVGTAEAREASK